MTTERHQLLSEQSFQITENLSLNETNGSPSKLQFKIKVLIPPNQNEVENRFSHQWKLLPVLSKKDHDAVFSAN